MEAKIVALFEDPKNKRKMTVFKASKMKGMPSVGTIHSVLKRKTFRAYRVQHTQELNSESSSWRALICAFSRQVHRPPEALQGAAEDRAPRPHLPQPRDVLR